MKIPRYSADLLTEDPHALVSFRHHFDFVTWNSNIVRCTRYTDNKFTGLRHRQPSFFDKHIPHLLGKYLVINRSKLGLMLPTPHERRENSTHNEYQHSFYLNVPHNGRVLIQLAPHALQRSFCRIEFPPSHFDAAAINVVVEWLSTIIFQQAYNALISKAYVSRVDWAIDLLELDFTKLFWIISHKRKGKAIHNDSTNTTESSYAGANSSDEILTVYNKILQLQCKNLPLLYPGYCNTPRVEFRKKFDGTDKILLENLGKIELPIDHTRFFYVDREPSNRALREIHNEIKKFGLFCVSKQLTDFGRDILFEHLRPHAIFPLDGATEQRAFSKEVEAKLKPFFAKMD